MGSKIAPRNSRRPAASPSSGRSTAARSIRSSKKLSGAEAEGDAGLEVVYEDDYVIAFHEVDDPADEHMHKWSVRVTVAPKHPRNTLLDLGVGDQALTAALLNGVQQAALKLRLHETGFEVFAGVLPPYQRNSYLTLRIRAGKLSKAAGDTPAAGTSAPPG